MDEKCLSIAQKLTTNGCCHLLIFISADISEHRMPVLGRSEDGGHLTNSSHGHFQRSRDRCRGHRQHVNGRFQSLDVLFMLDAKALFLVDYD